MYRSLELKRPANKYSSSTFCLPFYKHWWGPSAGCTKDIIPKVHKYIVFVMSTWFCLFFFFGEDAGGLLVSSRIHGVRRIEVTRQFLTWVCEVLCALPAVKQANRPMQTLHSAQAAGLVSAHLQRKLTASGCHYRWEPIQNSCCFLPSSVVLIFNI